MWGNYLNKKTLKINNTPITQFKQEPNKCHPAIMYFAAYSQTVHKGQGRNMLTVVRIYPGRFKKKKNCSSYLLVVNKI
jgi:hypothetical protein